MTVLAPENIQENTLQQDKVDTNTTQQNIDTKTTQQQTKQDEATEDPNWKAFREARKKDRAERDAEKRRADEKEMEAAALKAAMEAAFAKQIPTPSAAVSPGAYQDYYQQKPDETEDERIEKKVQAALAARDRKAEQERAERERQEYPMRLGKDFPDFNQTISQENLDYLDYHFPEVSRPLQRLPDGYDRWSDIYRAIKKFVPNNANAKKDSAKADANQMKPKSMSSTGITQPGESSNRTTMQEVEARRAARYAEMKKIINGVGQ